MISMREGGRSASPEELLTMMKGFKDNVTLDHLYREQVRQPVSILRGYLWAIASPYLWAIVRLTSGPLLRLTSQRAQQRAQRAQQRAQRAQWHAGRTARTVSRSARMHHPSRHRFLTTLRSWSRWHASSA